MEGIGFDINKLEEMKRPQLQKLCKKLSIKANSKTNQLIDDLKEYAKSCSAEHEMTSKTPESNNTSCLKVQAESTNTSENNEAEKESTHTHTCSEELSYKEQLMQHLEKKVEETLKESKIPRMMNKNVTFTVGSTPSQSKTREHPAFNKMDSIDVYLEKKRKRTQLFYANIKKAKDVADTARSIIADMKAYHQTGKQKSRQSPAAKRIRRSTFDINPNVKVPTSFSFGHIKSPKVEIKPVSVSQKQKAPKIPTRKSMSSLRKAKENKTPFDSNKSIAVTPFRYNETTSDSSVSAKKKFDLQASLSKPLNYKPHRGKIEKFPFVGKDSKIPVRVHKKSLVDHKVDVKNVKVTSRVERRQNNRQSRVDRRHNTLLARRGLVK